MKKNNEAPRPQADASRARSGERDASKGNIVLIMPLDPAYPALAGRGTCRSSVTEGGNEYGDHR
jgi:hypothetical protein